MLRIKNFSKTYGDKLVVDNFSIECNKGEIVGLIGPDGAGKTTILRTIATLQKLENGVIEIDGMDVKCDFLDIRKRLGYMPGQFSLYKDMSIYENLQFFMDLHGTSFDDCKMAIAPIYKYLEPFKNRKAGKLSGGMKQKLALCCALVDNPSLLLLDEPTTGVDPVSRNEFWNILETYKQQGTTIFVSTPYMDEASRCDIIALLNNGKTLDIGSPDQLVTMQYKYHFLVINGIAVNDIYRIKKLINNKKELWYAYLAGKSIRIIIPLNLQDKLYYFLRSLLNYQFEIMSVIPEIEDIFMYHLIAFKDD